MARAEAVVTEVGGFSLTREETQALQAVWRQSERVDWDVYDRLKARVLAWTGGDEVPTPVEQYAGVVYEG